MNDSELRTETDISSDARIAVESPVAPRGPVKSVTLLLPVWGYRFVSQFLEFCLPTLLAPGNIPAIAATLPCRFILLSSELDEPVIRSHPVWRALERVCDTEIKPVDDLITEANHTATITLAFARAVREAGESMLDTCFMFLVSDYLIADGSLRTVLERVRAGASGVLAGNYQIVAEDAIPLLRHWADPPSTAILLPPRELMRWSLAHLHPATIANIVNFGLSHNAHVNRLFWRVDENTLIGRFYLMHMIGIRPEVTDFIVGASCDYSFIPEMCPSGNVTALTDSDDYLVVEMQPRHHESKHLLQGPIQVPELAASLAEWATAEQRRNVENTIVYHAAEIPEVLPQFVTQADAFIDQVRGLLPPEAHPHRHHHYWIGSMAVNRARSRRPLSKGDWEFLLGEAVPSVGLANHVWSLRTKMLGTLPDVTRLHPRWPDYGLPLKALKQLSASGRLLLLAAQPGAYAQWLTRASNEIETLECDRLLELTRDLYMPLVGTFDACLLVLTEGKLAQVDEMIARAGPLLRPGGQIMIMVTNERSIEDAAGFREGFAFHAARLLNPSLWLTEIYYVPASQRRWGINRALHRLALEGDTMAWRSPGKVASLAIRVVPLTLATYLLNLSIRTSQVPPKGLWSSIFLILRPADGARLPLPQFMPDERARRSVLLRNARATHATSHRESDLASRRADAGEWHDDPDRLATTVARYRFVAGLVKSRHDVAQYGADALGTRLVLPKVKRLAVYDPDASRVSDVLRQFSVESPLEAIHHDILAEPLPKRHDLVFSLDTMQYVSRSDEDVYVRHLRDSVSRDHDVVILGSPSLWEPASASKPAGSLSAAAASARERSLQVANLAPAADWSLVNQTDPAIYTRSGEEMKALLTRYFHEVFIFSMVDDVIHAGMLAAGDYVFAICCGRK